MLNTKIHNNKIIITNIRHSMSSPLIKNRTTIHNSYHIHSCKMYTPLLLHKRSTRKFPFTAMQPLHNPSGGPGEKYEPKKCLHTAFALNNYNPFKQIVGSIQQLISFLINFGFTTHRLTICA